MNPSRITFHLPRRRPVLAALVALGLGTALAGCGPSVSEVRGTVRYNGKPLEQGNIQFLAQDGIPRTARLGPNGAFAIAVPAGSAKVMVVSVDEAKLARFTTAMAGRGGPTGRVSPPQTPKGNFSRIPQRYADWDASGLTIDVSSGTSVHDFTLTGP
jgi:hypothetical protein